MGEIPSTLIGGWLNGLGEQSEGSDRCEQRRITSVPNTECHDPHRTLLAGVKLTEPLRGQMKEETKKKISESMKKYHQSGVKKIGKMRKVRERLWKQVPTEKH